MCRLLVSICNIFVCYPRILGIDYSSVFISEVAAFDTRFCSKYVSRRLNCRRDGAHTPIFLSHFQSQSSVFKCMFFLLHGRKCTPPPARFTLVTRNARRTRESARFKTALGHTLGLALSSRVCTHSPNVGQTLVRVPVASTQCWPTRRGQWPLSFNRAEQMHLRKCCITARLLLLSHGGHLEWARNGF